MNFNIGNRITQLRSAKGYSVNKLANLAGISQSHLRDVERRNGQINSMNVPETNINEYSFPGFILCSLDSPLIKHPQFHLSPGSYFPIQQNNAHSSLQISSLQAPALPCYIILLTYPVFIKPVPGPYRVHSNTGTLKFCLKCMYLLVRNPCTCLVRSSLFLCFFGLFHLVLFRYGVKYKHGLLPF